ncbi:hypothetical protein BH09BAC4_BH09BAC4_48170 [soil metagenome]
MISNYLRLVAACFLLAWIGAPSIGQTVHTAAKQNESVWVISYPVKANKRAQYERFIHEIFWPGAKNLSAADQKIFKQTRVLHPTKPEADGSYAYLFIMDPVVKGADYGIESLLAKEYGAQKGKEYFKLFKDAIVEKNYKDYRVIQSKD